MWKISKFGYSHWKAVEIKRNIMHKRRVKISSRREQLLFKTFGVFRFWIVAWNFIEISKTSLLLKFQLQRTREPISFDVLRSTSRRSGHLTIFFRKKKTHTHTLSDQCSESRSESRNPQPGTRSVSARSAAKTARRGRRTSREAKSGAESVRYFRMLNAVARTIASSFVLNDAGIRTAVNIWRFTVLRLRAYCECAVN